MPLYYAGDVPKITSYFFVLNKKVRTAVYLEPAPKATEVLFL